MEYFTGRPEGHQKLEDECKMYTLIVADLKGALRNAKED